MATNPQTNASESLVEIYTKDIANAAKEAWRLKAATMASTDSAEDDAQAEAKIDANVQNALQALLKDLEAAAQEMAEAVQKSQNTASIDSADSSDAVVPPGWVPHPVDFNPTDQGAGKATFSTPRNPFVDFFLGRLQSVAFGQARSLTWRALMMGLNPAI